VAQAWGREHPTLVLRKRSEKLQKTIESAGKKRGREEKKKKVRKKKDQGLPWFPKEGKQPKTSRTGQKKAGTGDTCRGERKNAE